MWKFLQTQKQTLNPLVFSLLSVLVGIVAGLGAVFFRGLIALFHDLMFLGRLSLSYDANQHTLASLWGPLVILVPVAGALGVTFLVTRFAPEAKGHGVPEVMDAIYYHRGVIRPVVAVIKSLASALSIGSGGSVGREGPIIQIGSSFGSTLGQAIPMPLWQRSTLIAAGAAGGIAATFNTPVGGVLFAAELMMREVSARTLTSVAISTAAATYVGRIFLGAHPSFVIPAFEKPYFHATDPWALFFYVGLGLLMGLASAVFIRSLYAFEDFFEKRIKSSPYLRHGLGMLTVGGLMYGLMVFRGHYYIEGVGYSTIQDILSGTLGSLAMLAVLFALKLLSTSLTLGSGASGGIFSPSLFMGATLGGAYGAGVAAVFPGLTVAPVAFAVAGMAGMVSGATGAAVAALVMIFEMTLDYNVIVPMTVTVALSYGLRKLICPESIYTLKLARKGHVSPQALQADFHFLKRAKEVMDRSLVALPDSMTLGDFFRRESRFEGASFFLIVRGDAVAGVVDREGICRAREAHGDRLPLGRVPEKGFVVVRPEETLFDVISRLHDERMPSAVVVSGRPGKTISSHSVRGVIAGRQITEALEESVEPFKG
jgi:CIC family chloride channel protein